MQVAGMKSVVLRALLLALVLLQLASSSPLDASSMLLMPPPETPKRCFVYNEDRLVQAMCKDLKLEDVPNNLQKNIQVLVLSENRIRTLHNYSLARYTSLAFLYLQDNFVQKIDEGAFDPTEDLEVLNLSKNGLVDLPKSIFKLERLRNLYLGNNLLTDSQLEVPNVLSPLYKLELSGNRLTKMPQLKPLTGLVVLNVSHNSISSITVDDLAPLCSLKHFDFTGNPIRFNESTCECLEFDKWLVKRNITRYPEKTVCPKSVRERCGNLDFSNRTLSLYGSCMTVVRDNIQAQEARTAWMWIGSCIGAFVGFIFIALCCMHTHNKDKRQRLKEQEILASSNNANTEQLLNKEIQQEQS